ncbi:hypothetical protein CA984_35780 [Streptosporangium minutum]|uniref:Uncharacterized protein n=1 Tax=Streptosporangium minutum TaxID=569862 RepID=A0A243R8G9_9ACTN|nr:hypothetical protein CA984_35780 [Streptosporangium minutum]
MYAGEDLGRETASEHEGRTQPLPGSMPTGSAVSPDDIGGSPALIRISWCGDSIAGIMIRRFQFSYVISQVSSLYRLIGKNAASP